MKRFLSTALAVTLLLSLGALAVLARGGGDILAPADNVVSAAVQPQTAAAPDAPALSSNYNMIAIPLDVQATWASSTPPVPFTSQGLAQYVGISSVEQVLHWDPANQRYDSWFIDLSLPNGGYGYVNNGLVTDPWSLTTGHVYRLLLNNTDPLLARVSFVGDVPPANSIKFDLYGAASCQYNEISIPLEQTLATSKALADSMGGAANVSQVLSWNAGDQSYNSWFPDDSLPSGGYGYVNNSLVTDPWSVSIGYPYVVCLLVGTAVDHPWPN